MLIHNVKFDTKGDPILQNSIQKPSPSSKYGCVLGTLLFVLEIWKLLYNSRTTFNHYKVGFLPFFFPSPLLPFFSPSCQSNVLILLDPKYLSQIMSYLHYIFRETSCGCATMIKTKNKQIYKQTNKQTHF